MASQFKPITIFVLVILGAVADPVKPFPKVPASSGVMKKSVRAADVVENSASVSADGVLEIEARVDIHALLNLLQQIPFLKETVLQLLEEVKALKENRGSTVIEEELSHLKTDVISEVDGVQSNIRSAVEHSKEETLQSIEKILETVFEQRAHISSTCDHTFVQETTTQVASALIQNNKDLEKLISKQIRSDLSKLINTVESNSKVVTDLDEWIHGDEGPKAFASGGCDGLISTEEEIKKEIDGMKGSINNVRSEISIQIETAVNTSRSLFERRLEDVETLVKDALNGIALVANITKEMAAKQEQYFNSAVTEQTEIIQVVKKTQHYVKKQAATASEAASRIEKVAARTLLGGRNLGCQQPSI